MNGRVADEEKIGESLLSALNGYGAAIKELENKGNKDLGSDFDNVLSFGASVGDNVKFEARNMVHAASTLMDFKDAAP